MLAMLVLAVILTAGLQAPPTADAQMVVNNVPTGVPGIRDAANPGDTLTTVRPGMTLIAETTGIEDDDGITMVNWMYQWAHFDGTDVTDITGATAITYLLEEKDIGNALLVKVTFTDDLNNPEGPLRMLHHPFRWAQEPHRFEHGWKHSTPKNHSSDRHHSQACPRLRSISITDYKELHPRLHRADFRQHRRHGNPQ